MISFNLTAIIVFLSFLAFMFFMKSLFFDPLAKIKGQREEKMFDDQAQSDEAKRQLRHIQEDYEAQLKEARKKAQEQIVQISQAAKAEAAQTLAKTRQSVREDLEAGLAELAQWRESTAQQLSNERQALKSMILEKVVGSHSSISR